MDVASHLHLAVLFGVQRVDPCQQAAEILIYFNRKLHKIWKCKNPRFRKAGLIRSTLETENNIRKCPKCK